MPQVTVSDAAPAFTDRLAADPDLLDSNHPDSGSPPLVPSPLGPPPDPAAAHDTHDAHDQAHFTVDANDDGLDDSLQAAAHDIGGLHDDPWAGHDDHGAERS